MIISGNCKYGLSEALAKSFPNAEFYSRTNNHCDFSQKKSRELFARETLNHDLFLCVSSLNEFNQTLLLKEVIDLWIEKSKKGKIIVFGSILESITKDNFEFYAVEKKALRNYCRRVSLQIISDNGNLEKKPNFHLTYMSLGYLDSHGPRGEGKVRISCDYVTSVITWLIQQPKHINISEFVMEPIQSFID